jgi:tetratricopeptide (TPR) repeat protein
MSERAGQALLVEYFEKLTHDGDAGRFMRQVLSRYTEGTLQRLTRSEDLPTRQAAIIAIGAVGTMESNATLGTALGDSDGVVRILAQDACWSVWFRGGSPAGNRELVRIRAEIADGAADRAYERATRLILAEPDFAEAYNQRAIAAFSLGRYAASAKDCQEVLVRNPIHFGALGGLAQCRLRMGERAAAIEALERLSQLQPHNGEIRESIKLLEEAEDGRE